MTKDPRLAVLLYHNVGPRLPGSNRWLTVSPETFRRHVEWLSQHGYSGITARQWLEHLRGERELPAKPVMLTFDDGYQGLAEHAFPILQAHGFPAVVFIVTGLVGKADDWDGATGPTRMPLLDAAALRAWANGGIEFGAHGRTHRDLRKLRDAALRAEVAGSRSELEQLLGREVCAFAYPFGFHDAAVRAAVAEAFPLGFGTERGMNDRATDALQLRRSRIWPVDSAWDIRFLASRGWSPRSGLLAVAADVRNRILRRGPYE